MFDSKIFEVGIGLIFTYGLLGILVSLLLEWHNQKVRERGETLKKAIYHMLDDSLNLNYGYLFYRHPIIDKLKKDKNSLPQYISGDTFSQTVIDIFAGSAIDTRFILNEDAGEYVAQENGREIPFNERFVIGVQRMKHSPLKILLQNFISKSVKGDQTSPDLDQLNIEFKRWFDEQMGRVSGWFKIEQQKKAIFFGFFVAIMFNVDSIHLMNSLIYNDSLRNAINYQAQVTVDALSEQKTDSLSTQNIISALHESIENTNDTLKIKQLTALFNATQNLLQTKDSLNTRNEEISKMKESLAFNTKLPIGWNKRDAPISWFYKAPKQKQKI